MSQLVDGLTIGVAESVVEGQPENSYRCKAHADTGPLRGPRWNLTAPNVVEVASKLPNLPIGDLTAKYTYYHGAGLIRFLLGAELTRRGVPPSLRDNRPADLGCVECTFRLFLADAQWVVHRWPNHAVAYERYQRLFKPNDFLGAASYIFYFGKRPAFSIVNGLRLTKQQQAECAWLRAGGVAKFMATARRDEDHVLMTLKAALENRVMLRRMPSYDSAMLLKRWNLWRCDRVAHGRHALTARFYSAMTGLPMTRQNAAKLMAKVRHDLRNARKRA